MTAPIQQALLMDVISSVTPIAPSALTGLIGWWDAQVFASMTISGTDITNWADQSGQSNDMSGGAPFVPDYNATTFNGKPGAIWTLANFSNLRKTSFALGTGNTLTAFMVCSMTNSVGATTSERLMSYNANGQSHDYDNNASFVILRSGTSSDILFQRNSVASGGTLGYATPRRLIVTLKSDGTLVVYIDGAAVSTTTIAVANFTSPGTLCLGFSANDSSGFAGCMDGTIAEAGVATGYHDATTVAGLDAYLKTKWGL